MDIPVSVLVGFLPKQTHKTPDWLKNNTIKEICSVSTCISEAPDIYLYETKHNEFGFFNSEDIALSIIGSDHQKFDMYAYCLSPLEFNEGIVHNFEIPIYLSKNLFGFQFLGYDAANRASGFYFECSALSCNYGARIFPVNQYCLFESFDLAYKATIEISKGPYEPGPWYVLEVYRKIQRY
jgi:hypothetical protein